MTARPSKDDVPINVSDHALTIESESGLHRYIKLKNPVAFNRYFHVTTWPGYLAISGDMGSYVYSRVPDMFEFIGGDRINVDYWAEKLLTHDRNSNHQDFSTGLYHNAVRQDLKSWKFDSWSQMHAA